jgi:hypothetical protein
MIALASSVNSSTILSVWIFRQPWVLPSTKLEAHTRFFRSGRSWMHREVGDNQTEPLKRKTYKLLTLVCVILVRQTMFDPLIGRAVAC